jgi:hypothetical protein
MTFPLLFFLIAYLIFLAVWLVLSATALYHMFRFGFISGVTYGAIFLYVAVCVIILSFSARLILTIDWNYPVTIFGAAFDALPY